MSRFQQTFARLKADGACGLFPYLATGYPDLPTSQTLAAAALEAGVDGFEIGVPFSDPLADGATMQRVNQRALDQGASLETALELARFIRQRSDSAPIALMSYYNPIRQRGEARFAADLAAAGADGAIVPDLPLEESASLEAALAQAGVDFIPMLAPTSSKQRMLDAGHRARAFIYCVALVGVTGARQDLADSLSEFLRTVRASTSAPLVLGFGISRPEHVRRAASLGVQGTIVASALADLVDSAADPVEAARTYLAEMK